MSVAPMAFLGKELSLKWYLSSWVLAFGSLWGILGLQSSVSLKSYSSFFFTDGMSSGLIALSLWVSFLMIMASQDSVKSAKNRGQGFVLLICSLNLILILSFMFSNVFWFYIFFEASLIPTMFLILGWGYQPERLQASLYMMLYTISASLPLLVIIAFWSNELSSCSLVWSSGLEGVMEKGLVSEGLFFFGVAAFLVKLPVFCVHLWLPKAHVEAPVAGSMILAGLLLKLGGYGIFRMFQVYSLSCMSGGFVKDLLLCLCLWGGVVSSVLCLRQTDMKLLIAYSSVGHMSLVLGGIFSGSSWGWQGSAGMMIAHGLCSPGLFALANYNYEKSLSRSMLVNKGMISVCPSLSLWWFLFCSLNMAAPPSLNLISEIMVFCCLLCYSYFLMLPVMLMSFLTAGYSLYLFASTQHGGGLEHQSYGSVKSVCLSVLFLHYIPLNTLFLKSSCVFEWVF